MPKHFDMITAGGYFPASGKNTIRKVAGKYAGMKPGDTVTMTYCDRVENGIAVDQFAIEELTVAAVAHASFNRIIALHVEENHAVGCGHSESSILDLLTDIYDVQDGDEEQFLAIYFA